MNEEILHHRGTTLVRRLRLAAGEATPWHRDPFHRVTVILCGEALAIEYRDHGQNQRIRVTAGQADWDEPTEPRSSRCERQPSSLRRGYDLLSRPCRCASSAA